MKRRASTLILAWKAVLVLSILCCLYPQMSFATSPQDVKLEYDASTQMLKVTITHPSSFPSYHYIKHVEIKKVGADVMKNTYENQPDMDTFTYTYKVPAAECETLQVTATCSLYGYKTVNLTIGKE
ncbi:MAG: hypothetical protein ACXWL9_03450 [Syntrophales bacterium]